jgi:hypothetical protein
MTRLCTCVGSCKGGEGLAPGWVCAIEDAQRLREAKRAERRQKMEAMLRAVDSCLSVMRHNETGQARREEPRI